jgi:hypothetical protein
MAVSSIKPGTPMTIIAGAQSEGALLRMLSGRDVRYFVLDHDPHLKPGDWLIEDETLLGRVTWVGDNGDPDDWITGQPTKWTVKFEKPWNQTEMHTTLGRSKIEWLEDTLMPRIGRVIDCDPHGAFMLGDIVRLG